MGAFERTSAILREHRALLEASARELLARETLDEDALRTLTAPLRAQMAAPEAASAEPAAPPPAGLRAPDAA